jgi:hypothetical protein
VRKENQRQQLRLRAQQAGSSIVQLTFGTSAAYEWLEESLNASEVSTLRFLEKNRLRSFASESWRSLTLGSCRRSSTSRTSSGRNAIGDVARRHSVQQTSIRAKRLTCIKEQAFHPVGLEGVPYGLGPAHHGPLLRTAANLDDRVWVGIPQAPAEPSRQIFRLER